MNVKAYKRGEMLEAQINGYWMVVTGISGKRVITKDGRFKYSQVAGWRLPWGATFQPNLHMVLPLCNRGSQRIW